MSLQPQIKAEFVLDADGKPLVDDGHYEIRISIYDAPADAHRVTYQLDESTYYDPVRDAHNPGSGFAEELTSYGDFEIMATVRLKDRPIFATRGLAEALRETYASSTDSAVLDALRAISEN